MAAKKPLQKQRLDKRKQMRCTCKITGVSPLRRNPAVQIRFNDIDATLVENVYYHTIWGKFIVSFCAQNLSGLAGGYGVIQKMHANFSIIKC